MAEQDENLEADPDEEKRRARFRAAAQQGEDQLAAVLDEQIQGLAEEFEVRVERVVTAILGDDRVPGNAAVPRQFVVGSAFGAILFLLSLIASLRVVRPKRE